MFVDDVVNCVDVNIFMVFSDLFLGFSVLWYMYESLELDMYMEIV